MRVSVFGLGYVGAVSCGCLAEIGHDVIGVDVAADKVELVKGGRSPILERELPDLIRRMVEAGRLTATTDAAEAVAGSDVALVCVGTPSTPTGGTDETFLRRVHEQIGAALAGSTTPFFAVLNRSTCLPETHVALQEILERTSGRRVGADEGYGVGYACHPEFMREGSAVADFRRPPRIVFGAADAATEQVCRRLYPGIDAETFVVAPEVASMVKYADNCFHALKVTFGNEIGMLCQAFGVDARAVMDLFCADRELNISTRYLRPGPPFGGSCLPKDLRGVLDAGRRTATPLPMLTGALESNRIQVEQLLERIAGADRPAVGLVGLAFKEGTDDVRESPAVALVEQLCGKGYPVRIFDSYLSLQSLVGANRGFALASIPHLADLLGDDLQAVIDRSVIIVVSHRLTEAQWRGVRWKPGQRVLDLVGIEALRDAPGYEGLYWSSP